MSANNQTPGPRVRQLFLAALDIADPAERERFLDQSCGPDQELRRQVKELLIGHKDDSFLERPAVQPGPASGSASDTTLIGRTAGAAGAAQSQYSLRPKPTIRYFGDYELLEEIARGGMGVVWKARQKSLNRILAVKMILSGRLASEADVKRFRTEAEAAANLQHPNIVAIHEVGEHEGQNYFSMDLVDGPTLAELVKDGPLPAGKAAQYVKAIAEAVQFAHQRGILHRDLKPSNVLVDSQDRVRVTDFGLAKVMHGDSDLTRSGDVMGSPAYMAPEQAQARHKLVGPPSDVYSLGALLYHLLTGKPPFSGETAVETLRQALDEEPVPPSRHNPKIPADLETICLKCLAKLPEHRYATARDLAEELERFLNYEPILAKPASPARRAWNWVQKNPWAIAGAAASLVLLLGCLAYGFYQRMRYLDWKANIRTKLETALPDAPAVLFFTVLPLLVLLLYIGRKTFRRSFQMMESRGRSLSLRPLAAHAAIGLLAVAIGMGAMLLQIKSWAWQMLPPMMLWMEVPGFVCAGVLLWMGFLAVWEAVGIHESSRFREVVGRSLAQDVKSAPLWRSVWRLAGISLWLCILGVGGSQMLYRWLLEARGSALVVGIAAILFSGAFGLKLCLAVRQRRRLLTRVFIPAILYVYALLFISCFQGLGAEGKLLLFSLLSAVLASLGSLFFHKVKTLPELRPRFPVAPWKEILGGLAFAVAVLVVFQVEENWRGRRAWAKTKAELEAKGEVLDLAAYLKPPVPAAQNVMEHPYMKKYFIKGVQAGAGIPFKAAPPQFRSVGFPFPLPFLKNLPRESGGRPPLRELAASRASEEIIPVMQFNRRPVAEVVFELAARAGLKVEAQTNRAPFANAYGRALDYSGSFTNTTALQALDAVTRQWELVPDLERWRQSGVLALEYGSYTSLRELDDWYRTFSAEFAQLEEALQRPYSRLPLDTNQVFYSPIPNFVSLRTAAQTYVNRCKVHLLLGDSPAALKDLQNLRKLADCASSTEPPMLVSAMIRVAIIGLFSITLEETLQAGLWSADQMEALQRLCAEADLLRQMSRSLRGGERAAMLYEFDQRRRRFAKDPMAMVELIDFSGKRPDSKLKAAAVWVACYQGWFYQNAANYARFHQIGFEAMDAQGRILDANKLRQNELGDRLDGAVVTGFYPYYTLSAIAIPNTVKASLTTAKNQVRVDQVLVACALERHRSAYGQYPDQLEALVPGFLKAVPLDVLDNQPLRYRKTADGRYLLWSIGTNNKDDGGELGQSKAGVKEWSESSGDWVWQGVPVSR